MPLVMPRLLMPLSLRYTSVVSLFGLLSVLNTCRHYLSGEEIFKPRHAYMILRDMVEQVIEFIYQDYS